MLKTIKTTGRYTQYAGLGLIFMMAVVGTVAIDVVIIAAMLKAVESNNRRGNGFGDNPFVTLMLWNMMFNSSGSRDKTGVIGFGLQLLIAPVTTVIAIGLSFLLGVPQIGVALIAGWVVALGVLAVGYTIEQAADSAIQYFHSTTDNMPSPLSTVVPREERLNGTSVVFAHDVSTESNRFFQQNNSNNIPIAEAHLVHDPVKPSAPPKCG